MHEMTNDTTSDAAVLLTTAPALGKMRAARARLVRGSQRCRRRARWYGSGSETRHDDVVEDGARR